MVHMCDPAGTFLQLMAMAAAPSECGIPSFKMLALSGTCATVDASLLARLRPDACAGLAPPDKDDVATAQDDKTQAQSVFGPDGSIMKG
eukprot:9483726-Pyramimonas_sp.AAC.1